VEPTTLFTLALSLAILIGLFLLHRRAVSHARGAGIDAGKQQGFAAGLSEKQRQLYAQGYADGKAEGRELERRELKLSAERAYDHGLRDGLGLALDEVHDAMRDEARQTLSA
jgi:hypothetical protein